MARFSSDLTAVENAATWAVASLVLNTLSILLGAVLLFLLEWHLALLTVFGLLVCVKTPHARSKA